MVKNIVMHFIPKCDILISDKVLYSITLCGGISGI